MGYSYYKLLDNSMGLYSSFGLLQVAICSGENCALTPTSCILKVVL